MDGRILLLSSALLATACLGACESSPRAAARDEKPAATKQRFGSELIELAEVLRDREFRTRPTLQPRSAPAADRSEASAGSKEAAALRTALLGDLEDETPAFHARLARWDAENNRVIYDARHRDEAQLRVAIVRALVRGLEAQHFASKSKAQSFDAQLAHRASTQAGPAFVAVLAHARTVAPELSAEDLARRPDLAQNADALKPFLEDFAFREGFTLAAAMYRGGGWSAVEALHDAPPEETGFVVRPDRWLGGEDLGQWTWPAEIARTRKEDGWKLSFEGRVGPALIEKLLARHIDARLARTVYIGWQSDSYRLYHRGETWLLEWVSLWNTPSNAQQVVEAIDAALRRAGEKARYSVVRKGATVAVIGAPADADPRAADLSTVLVEAPVKFEPNTPHLVRFVPTPVDTLARAAMQAKPDDARWDDPATGLGAELSALEDWELRHTQEPRVRWFAQRGDALIQLTTEMYNLLGPAFATDAYRERWFESFQQTLSDYRRHDVETIARPHGPVLYAELEGAPAGLSLRRFAIWQTRIGDYLVTYSFQAPPDDFAQERAVAQEVFETFSFPRAMDGSSEKSEGTIEYRVE